MSFSDAYKRQLLKQGGSVLNSDIIHSKNATNRAFANDISFKVGHVQNLKMELSDIDTRRVSKDKNAYDKDIYLRPDTIIDTGSYIIYDDGTYLVTGFNEDYINPKCIATKCEQELRFSFIDGIIPCIAEGESYGVKISAGTQFNTTIDTKIRITVQDNEKTKLIKPKHRFILNHNEFGVYKVGDVTVYNNGTFIFTCQKDKYMPKYDDLENNIAYNGDMNIIEDNTETGDYIIKGVDTMIVGQTEIFTLNPNTEGVTWVIDNTYSANDGVASIISQDNDSCTIKCSVGDDCFEIKAIKDGQQINSNEMIVLTARR